MTIDMTQSTNSYTEHEPHGALRRHFRRVWFHHIPAGPAVSTLIVPDGCVDIHWMAGKLTVAGPDRTAVQEMLDPGSTVVGMRFQPATAANWLNLPLTELLNRRVALEDIWGGEARRLGDFIGMPATPELVAQRLQQGLHRHAAVVAPAAKEMVALFAMSNMGNRSLQVKELAERLGISERNLRRRCEAAYGYGPKTLQRILRFQRFLAYPHRHHGLADAAIEAGYADQAHLSREVAQLTGATPSRIIDLIVK